jgi:type IV secretory pathway VirB2 component (pilin)
MLAIAALALIVPQASFAGLGSVGTTMCGIYNCVVGGNLITVIATVGIFFLGIGAFFGKVNWGLVIIIALGIVVIVGAMNIAVAFTGGNGCSSATTAACA